MANWAELPKELLELIISRINTLSNQIRFSGVCSSWRSVGVEKRRRVPRQFPGLMIPSTIVNGETRRFLRLPGCRVNEQRDLPVPHKLICIGSTEGWIIVTHESMDMSLLNPFSGAQISLPPVATLPSSPPGDELTFVTFEKAVLSSNPSLNQDVVVLVIYRADRHRLAFCRLGDDSWRPIEAPKNHTFWDAIWHEGKFYAVYNPGALVTCDIDNQPKVLEYAPAPESERFYERRYLMECGGALLLVRRERRSPSERYYDDSTTDEEEYREDDLENDEHSSDAEEVDQANYLGYINNDHNHDGTSYDRTTDREEHHEDDAEVDEDEEDYSSDAEGEDQGNNLGYVNNHSRIWDDDESDDYDIENHSMLWDKYNTFRFKVYKFLSSKRKWVRVASIGNYALFLGMNSSFSLSAADFPACRGDCIYFTDDDAGPVDDLRGGHDMGIFSLKNKTFEPFFPIKPNQLLKPPPIFIAPIPW
ncbi:hypothetical protein RJ639_008010 [Escallonia herrerae]|uniref:F-box domain-containing protein n=1 Tax=Escallonia herrerae TaxID=1293975 RepID=A0AA88VUL6_9ASTE|nr:hypothetical protein RJ639_008010 [Escallonia herrerae]